MAVLTVPSSGPVSMSTLAAGLDISGAASLDHIRMRMLANKLTGPVSFSDFHGKVAISNPDYTAGTFAGFVGWSLGVVGSNPTTTVVKGQAVVEVGQFNSGTSAIFVLQGEGLAADFFKGIVVVNAAGTNTYALSSTATKSTASNRTAWTWSGGLGLVSGQPFTLWVFY